MSTFPKMVDLDEAVQWRAVQQGKVVFTNGVFDLLHPGHVEYLEAARRLGDALIVGVNDDDSASRLGKGPGRPFVHLADRMRILAGLASVDRVVSFGGDTPFELISALRPDVLAKGGDYAPETIVGGDLVVGYGGRVEILPFVTGYSSTATAALIVGKLRAC